MIRLTEETLMSTSPMGESNSSVCLAKKTDRWWRNREPKKKEVQNNSEQKNCFFDGLKDLNDECANFQRNIMFVDASQPINSVCGGKLISWRIRNSQLRQT